MNQLLSTRTYRFLCHVLIVTLIAPTWMLALALSPAEAQTSTLAVGVVDFRNDSGVQGETLSRLATDAVALELAKQPSFDIFQRSAVTQQMKTLGINPPLNKIMLSKLGEALVADAMVDGAIRDVQIKGSGGSRRAAVTLVVRMLDQASGEVINGGVQTGYSNPRVGYTGDDDTLITEAIDNAAFLVVKTMSEYIIPEATVQNSIGDNQVMLNKGSRDGIKRGMRMIVKRDKEIIGYLQVTSLSPNDAVATIVRAMRGVKAEDKATAIFDMPAVSEVRSDPSTGNIGAPPVKKSASKMGKTKNILLGILALGGLIALLNTGGSGGDDPGSSSATLTANGVQVKWNSGSLWGGKNVLEAHVWRDDVTTPIISTNWNAGQAIDYLAAATNPYRTANPQDKTEVTGTTTVPVAIPGRSYMYKVSALYTISTPNQTELSYVESELSTAGRVTYIQKMDAATDLLMPEPNATIGPYDNNFAFQWKGKTGADTYVIQVSTNPSFPSSSQTWTLRNPITWDPNAVNPVIPTQPMTAPDDLRSWLYNITKDSTDTTNVYWRVGCRNSGDTVQNYLYSAPAVFQVPENPPGR